MNVSSFRYLFFIVEFTTTVWAELHNYVLLNHVPKGPALEKPTALSTRCTESEESFRKRLLEGLLPAQREFVDDTEHLILGFCGGFGAGKTRALEKAGKQHQKITLGYTTILEGGTHAGMHDGRVFNVCHVGCAMPINKCVSVCVC